MSDNIDSNEPLLREDEKRLTILPIKCHDLWKIYKEHESAIWHASEVKLDRDLKDWNELTEDARYFIKLILAFFASSDLIIAENLASRFLRDVKNTEAKVFYGFQIMDENIHCVAPETKILTETGFYPICNLVGQVVKVWNGVEYSSVTIRQTSDVPVKLFKITLSNGAILEVTDEHKWVIKGQEERCLTKNLKVGDEIITYDMPIVYNGKHLEDAYNKGNKFAMDRISVSETSNNSRKVFEQIPLSDVDLQSKIQWLSGYLDMMLIHNITKHDDNGWYINDSIDMLRNLQLLLQTVGLNKKININESSPKESYILILQNDGNHLKRLGLATKHFKMDISGKIAIPIDDSDISVEKIEDTGRCSLTYCFNEPINHTGIFNGVLTGQSEVYSMLIDKYITDEAEKIHLFNAVETIPCVKKKAQWAMKWIESSDSFATRLIAFAIVEGVFFSGAFCCIYWLSEQGKMPGLTKSNDFIARDEGIHTKFACVLYNKYIVNKLTFDKFKTILVEAVEIEIEFITESLPCRLIGMNATLMKQYIKYVANRLSCQLGYDEVFENIKQPFDFMDRLALRGKNNFFEEQASEYKKTSLEAETDVDPYADIN